MLFDHCTGPDDAWNAFYLVACLCHPSQGGLKPEFLALCAMAREVVNDWPDDWPEIPNLFDIFCKATKRENPFTLMEPKENDTTTPDTPPPPVPFEPSCQFAPAVVPLLGRVIRVFTAER